MIRHDHVDREVGARIRERRSTLGLSQRELADGICSYALVSRFEKGTRIPGPGKLNLLARRLGTNAAWLGTGQHDPAVDLERAVEILDGLEALGEEEMLEPAREAREIVRNYLSQIGWTNGNSGAIGSTVKTDDAGKPGR